MADSPNATVVDELVVKLTLDGSEYDKTDKAIAEKTRKTTKTQEDADRKEKRRDAESKKREQEKQKRIKEMTGTVKELAGISLAVLGIGGGMAGVVGMLAGLASTESAMKRATTATGMNVRQMNAWRMTAQRLTGDAEGGAAAVAALAREQQTGRYSGNMPIIAALASVGVNARANESVESILAHAQERYRSLPAAQQQTFENLLANQGVDANLIQAIKSNQSISEVYNKSYGESAEMNEQGVDAFNDALASLKNNLRDTATVLMQTLTPAIQTFATAISEGARWLAGFSDDMKKAGGGVQGFTDALNSRAPKVAQALDFLHQTLDVIVFGLKEIALVIGKAYDWLNSRLGGLFGKPESGKGSVLDTLADKIKGLWKDTVAEARNEQGVRLTPGAANRIAGGALGAPNGRTQEFMQRLIAAGFTPVQAAAITANAQHESGLKASATNASGAAGLLQWLGPRKEAYTKMFGHGPEQGNIDEMIRFITTDPEEKRSMQASFAAGGSAQQLGVAFSQKFERHGKAAEDIARGVTAQRIFDQFNATMPNGATTAGANAPTIAINGPVTVQANNPQEFMSGMQRVSGVANYNSATR